MMEIEAGCPVDAWDGGESGNLDQRKTSRDEK